MRFKIACIVLAFAGSANADDRQWQLEIHGGVATSTSPSSGTPLLPDPNPTATAVPSWYFGDGAQLLREAFRSIRPSISIASLDQPLKSRFLDRGTDGQFGLRLGRTLTRRWSAEFSVDQRFGRPSVDDDRRAALDNASAGFINAFSVLMPPLGGNQSVTSAVSIEQGHARHIVTTGALTFRLGIGRLAPYGTFGAGATIRRNESVTAQLTGSYKLGFPVPPGIPFPFVGPSLQETDTVTIHSSNGSTFTALFGGGIEYSLAERWGIRFDVRDHVSPNDLRTVVTAAPTAERSQSSASIIFIPLLTMPALRFSSSPAIPSTLSSTLSDQPTFRGTGIVHQVHASLGVYWRF